ncbi:hypothetical protein [Streptomyces sp. SLBN-31]|uniref:hypothetical protein n=1 Tax=Streptomyces sp. SLBN-31 TaxID=2768444 RepID=UPI00115369A2|nr:hypothetical protein [Streptomyces sp. SLBN-31]
MNGRAWKWALISAPMALSVSACIGWGGYRQAQNVRASRLVGTWRAQDCDTTLTLRPDGSASAAGIPTDMDLHGKTVDSLSGDGTWDMYESGAEQELDVTMGNEETPFNLCLDKGHLMVGLTVGDPDDMNWCVLTGHSAG